MIRKLLLVNMLLSCINLVGQEIEIAGKVTQSDLGEPLPGVSVLVKGSTTGTVTNLEGEFSIRALPGATLVISYVGMLTKEIALDGQITLSIELEADVFAVDEVVVTALGVSKQRKRLGYSIQSINNKALEKSQNANLLNSIGGRVAGVQVTNAGGAAGSGAYMVIRGQASFTRSNSPLFVVDGVPIDNSQFYSGNPDNGRNNLNEGVAHSNRVMDLNPDDIESVSVLKGGAATALYGIRAANGAVVITTKKGGASNSGKLNIEFNQSYSFDKVNRLPELQNTFVQGARGDWLEPAPGVSFSWGARADEMAWNDDSSFPWDKNGRLVPKDSPEAKKEFIPYDNVGDFFRTGHTSNSSLSLNGGNEVSSFYLSIAHTNTSGVVPKNTWKKSSIKLSGTVSPSEKIRISGSANFINSGGSRMQQGSNYSGIMVGLLRTPISFDNSNGFDDPVNTPKAYEQENGFQRNYRAGAGFDNPYWSVNKNNLSDKVNRLIGYAGLQWHLLPGVDINYKLGLDFYSDSRHSYFGVQSRQYPAGQVAEDNYINKDLNSDLLLKLYQKKGELEFNLTLGHNMFATNFEQLYVQGDDLTIKDFYHLSNASTFLQRQASNRKRTAAFFGDFAVDWKNMVFLNLTGRNEWSTSMPADNNSFFYPSASLGWVLTELAPLQRNPVLSFAKLRGSYTINAYDATTYSVQDVYILPTVTDSWTNGISFPYQGTPGFTFNDIAPGKDLRPEKLESIEAGAEFYFFLRRLSLDVTYYNNLSKDLLLSVPGSGANGYVATYMNAGSMRNQGVEVSFGLNPIKFKNIQWDILLNYTKNKNEVLELAPGVESIPIGGFFGAEIRVVPNQPYGIIYGDSFLRYDENGDGKPQPEEPVIIISDPANRHYGYPVYTTKEIPTGNNQPDWLMGISNTVKIYDFTISALIDIRKGGDIWNGTRGHLNYFGMSKETEDRETATKVFEGVKGYFDSEGKLVYTGEKNDIEVPLDQRWYFERAGNGVFGPGEQFVEDGSWIRLKELTISYELPTEYLQKMFIERTSVYFTGKNLWLKTNYKGIDPETSLYGSHNAQGLDFFNMPGIKSYVVGLRMAF